MKTGVVWIIIIYLVDYWWVKSPSNVCLRVVWKLGAFYDFLTFHSAVTTWKGLRKCLGRVMKKSLNFILEFLYEPCCGFPSCSSPAATQRSQLCVITVAIGLSGTLFGTGKSDFATLLGKGAFGSSVQLLGCPDRTLLSISNLGALLAGTTASSSSMITQSGVSRPESLLYEQSSSFTRLTLDFTLLMQ